MEYRTSINGLGAVTWKNAWMSSEFRVKFIVAGLIFIAIILFFPTFFATIERRNGILLDDWVLPYLPAVDVSVPTFLIIWLMTVWLLFRCVRDPSMALQFLCGIILLFCLRMIAIMLVPLDPPLGLIPLKDPLASIGYGGKVFIRKDLFFSGHTSVQFLIFLSLKKRTDKILALCATVAIGVLVLIQHVHYTIDVLGALPVAYCVAAWSKKISTYQP